MCPCGKRSSRRGLCTGCWKRDYPDEYADSLVRYRHPSRRKTRTLICKCGTTFTTDANYQKWCSPQCAERHRESKRRYARGPSRATYMHRRWIEKLRRREAIRLELVADVLAEFVVPTQPLLLSGPPPAPGRVYPSCPVQSPVRREWTAGECPRCGDPFVAPVVYQAIYCSKRCTKAAARARHKHLRRVQQRTAPYDRGITHLLLARRDEWKCHVCNGEVTRQTWSIDHLLALSRGGTHTWDNVSLAHHWCNTERWIRVQAAA